MYKYFFALTLSSFLLPATLIAQWTETKLSASDGAEDDHFGYSVSISGDYAIIGEHDDDDNGTASGSAYVFRRKADLWVEEAKLKASDGAYGDIFGIAVSISGDYALVGARGEGSVGAAYVFHREGSLWVEQAKLTSSDGETGDYFGQTVAVSSDYALIGAYYEDNDGEESGAAYVYRREGTQWVEDAKLKASDWGEFDFFGRSVAISGDYLLIGSYYDDDKGENSGSAYVFRREGTLWVEESKLTASDGGPGDLFGLSSSIFGNYALVSGGGSAYVFRREANVWLEEAKLDASDGAEGDNFGISLSISDDYAIVGAWRHDHLGSESAAAYLFRREDSTWVEETELLASDGTSEDYFGVSVSISGNNALVGSWFDDDNGNNSGSAYVYSIDHLAQRGVCYASTGSADPINPGALLTIDPLTGIGTLLGPTGIIGNNGPSVPCLAINSTGVIYALSASNSSSLFSIDASTGEGTYVATTGLNAPDALAFDQNDILYAVANNTNLYAVDPATGAVTLIGPTGFTTKAMSYDPTDGAMYGCSNTDEIYTIDLFTGNSTLIGTTGLGGAIHAIHFDQEGNMYGTKGSASTPYTLISIDKATAQGTTIGEITGFTAVIGLASRVLFTPAVDPVTVDVEIDSLLKFVPAEGDTFPYTVTITNLTSQTQLVDWWTKVIRPSGPPIDPLSGPTAMVLDRFETAVIDTPLLPVPFNAVEGDYSLIAYIGRYLADTLGTDTTDFHKLPAIPCEEVANFQARCRPGGLLQARVILANANHTGDIVEFTIDDVGYQTTVNRNGRALFSQTGFNIGSHTVELTQPSGCFDPIDVFCPGGAKKTGDDFWEDDTSWERPTATTLLGNYPNPFNPSTTFRYGLSEPGQVTLKIYNTIGQLVKTIVSDYQSEGYHEAVWDGRNESGATVASGIYVYRMVAGMFVETRKMLLMK